MRSRHRALLALAAVVVAGVCVSGIGREASSSADVSGVKAQPSIGPASGVSRVFECDAVPQRGRPGFDRRATLVSPFVGSTSPDPHQTVFYPPPPPLISNGPPAGSIEARLNGPLVDGLPRGCRAVPRPSPSAPPGSPP